MRPNAEARAFLTTLRGPEGGGSAERPWRVLEWANTCSGKAFWAVILREWPMFDRIPHAEFAAAFAKFADHAPPKPKLPHRMTVYRGQAIGAPSGLSWTLDRAQAEAFSRGRRRSHDPATRAVLELEVTLDQVAFYTNDRGEQEVVLLAIPAFHNKG